MDQYLILLKVFKVLHRSHDHYVFITFMQVHLLGGGGTAAASASDTATSAATPAIAVLPLLTRFHDCHRAGRIHVGHH